MSPEELQAYVDRALDEVRHQFACVIERVQGDEVVRDVLLEQISTLKAIIEQQREEIRELEARKPLRMRSWIRRFKG